MTACKLKSFLIEGLCRAQSEDTVCEHDGCCHCVCVCVRARGGGRVCVCVRAQAGVCARAGVCVCTCARLNLTEAMSFS